MKNYGFKATLQRHTHEKVVALRWCPLALAFSILTCAGCATGPVRGPDKRSVGTFKGALMGAGAGAVTGFQVAAATGPGAAIGAGLGAVAGGFQGVFTDWSEERLLNVQEGIRAERERAFAHKILRDHYNKRLMLHPSRDVYPADLFFSGADTTVCYQGNLVLKEFAAMLQDRLPWSRVAVISYVVGRDLENQDYSRVLAEQRALEMANELIRFGLEPRRVEARAKVVEAPILIDPGDDPTRYSQAIEFALVDY